MKDNSLGAEQLNEKARNEKELDKEKQELYEVKKKIEELDELPKGYKEVSLSKYNDLNIKGKFKNIKGITEKNVYALEIENEKQSENDRLTQLYIYREKELFLLATINEKEELILSDNGKEYVYNQYKDYLSKEELEQTFTIDSEKMEKEKQFCISLSDEKENNKNKEEERVKKEENKTEEKNKQDDSKTSKIANAIGVKPENVLTIVEVKDETTMSRLLNKNVETKNLYAVKIRQDSGGVGSNDWIIVNEKSNGNFEQAMKEDNSDTMQDLAQKLGIKEYMNATDFKEGDISGTSQIRKDVRYYKINQYRFSDNTKYVMLQTFRESDKSDIHIYEEIDGELIPICEEDHEHKEEEVPLLDNKKADIIERPKGGRTRGDDAWTNRFGEE